MRCALLSAAVAILLGPSSGGAQSLTMTESDALARASNSAREQAIRAGVPLARAGVLSAGRWPNPSVTVNRESVAGVTEYITSVSQPLPLSGRRGLEVRAASTLVEAAASRVDDDVRRMRADVRLAFADLVAAQVRERELMRARDRLNGVVTLLAAREAAGDVAGFDRMRAAREVFEVETDVAASAIGRARAQAALASYFPGGIDPSTLVAIDDGAGAHDLAPVPALDGLVARAEATRGELASLRQEADAGRLSARAAERRRWPEPDVSGGTKSATFPLVDIGTVVAVTASVPLFDRGRPEHALALALASQADARADAFRQVLRAQVAALRESVVQTRRLAERYREDGLAPTAEIERIAQVSYEAGERSIVELLDAFRLGASARSRQGTLEWEARRAAIELEFVTGWEMRR